VPVVRKIIMETDEDIALYSRPRLDQAGLGCQGIPHVSRALCQPPESDTLGGPARQNPSADENARCAQVSTTRPKGFDANGPMTTT